MINFTAKFIFVVSILIIGILLGIQQAEHGILSLQSNSPHSEQEETKQEQEVEEEVYITKIDDDQVEVAIVGEGFSVEKLEEKKEKWKDSHHHNKWSHLGTKLGEVVYTASRVGVEWLVVQIDKVI